MQFRAILTSFVLFGGLICTPLALAKVPTHKKSKPQAVTAVVPKAAASAPVAPLSKADAVFLEMQQAFKSGDRKRLTALLPQAKGHLLEPWAAYWELRARLDVANTDEIQAFFKKYKGSYQEDRLRNDWLLLLGQRRDWDNFTREHVNFRMADDREVACYAQSAEFVANGTFNLKAFKQTWYSQREADDGCLYLATQLYQSKKINDLDIWRKTRLAMEANKARLVRQSVEIISDKIATQLDEINANAAKFLKGRLLAIRTTTKEEVLLAVIKLAASDPSAAAEAMDKHWDAQFTPEQRSWAWGAIGKAAVQRLNPAAPGYFANAKDEEMTDEQLAWKVRANLRIAKWKEVLSGINAMSDEAQTDSAWVYWKARALLALAPGEAERLEANRLLGGMASMRGFYEQLAAEELGRRISLPGRVEPPLSETEKLEARNNPGLNRALAAINLSLRSEGVREWNYHTNLHMRGGMNDRALLAAADFACEREVWDRCINTSERTKQLLDVSQRYPLPFKSAVLAKTKEIGLDPAYAYAVMRQESRFMVDARSGVGATGLMQLMPATARWAAKKIGLTDFQPHQVMNRDTNIALGTGYLKLVLDNFAGSMPMAAAAYNAGPGRPRNWRGQTGGPTVEAAIWAENIPFNETRDYVKKVMANTTVYAALLSGQAQSLKARLGNIGPLDANRPEIDPELP